MKAVLVDTSGLYEYFNRRTSNHVAANRWRVERATPGDEERARTILMTHSDKDYSYTDAVSFAIMERLGISMVFSFDRHFVQYGFQVIGPAQAGDKT